MPSSGWQPLPAELAEDGALADAVLAAYAEQYRSQFADDPAVNHALPIELRSLRAVDGWRAALLLTPWMLARLWFPDRPPELALPPGWSAAERHAAPPTVLGPTCSFTAAGATWKAHFVHHCGLGHSLIQPLIMAMAGYASADAVFAAWDQVIRTRDANMAQAQRDCLMQKEVSRHELLARVFRRGGR